MNASYHIVIPARMASQRLPGKPLAMIAGRPLIEHVWRQACKANARSVVIATDSEQILRAAASFGAEALMTAVSHNSGSDRICECANMRGWDDQTLIVNLQGDEPLMPPACLDQAANLLHQDPAADVASLYWPISSAEEVEDPNAVKVVVDQQGNALYFSRSAVPFARGSGGLVQALDEGGSWKRHIGLYAYRAGALRAFAGMQATPLESMEKLEQLRFLESGRRIVMAQAEDFIPAGVDTPEDLERVQNLLS